MDRIKKYLSKQYRWYVVNLQKIIFIAGLHLFLSYFVKLPYINIFTSLFSFLPYLFDWLAILVLFRPKKDLILKVGLSLFVLDYFLALIKLNFVLEALGEVSFLMIGTYIVLSLQEIREK